MPHWHYWWVWQATWERWRREGMPPEFRDFADVRAHFGADPVLRVVPVKLGPVPDFTQRLSEDATSGVHVDSWG